MRTNMYDQIQIANRSTRRASRALSSKPDARTFVNPWRDTSDEPFRVGDAPTTTTARTSA
jgi:hypothetical protein